mgnify:CR=1 FL=1
MKLKASIKSMRLRTLPLSLSGVILGVTLAADKTDVSPWTAALIFLTTVCLQILTNLSNELGDTISGTDSADRQGPQYALGSGEMTIGDIKKLILMFIGLCVISGLAMIQVSFGSLFKTESICLEALGAAAIGCFSVGVLNVNNIRDMKTDAVNRVTMAIKLGMKGARIYQTILIAMGWVLMVTFCLLYKPDPGHFLFLAVAPLHMVHLRGVWTRTEKALDPMLPLLVMSTFILSILAGAGFLIF